MLEGPLNLFLGRPACRAVLPVTHSFGLDPVQCIVVGEDRIAAMMPIMMDANPELSTLWPVVRVLDIDPFELFYPGVFRDDARIRLLQQMVGECTEQEADALIPAVKEMIAFMRKCQKIYVK